MTLPTKKESETEGGTERDVVALLQHYNGPLGKVGVAGRAGTRRRASEGTEGKGMDKLKIRGIERVDASGKG